MHLAQNVSFCTYILSSKIKQIASLVFLLVLMKENSSYSVLYNKHLPAEK